METRIDPDEPLVKACQEPDSDRFEAAFEGLYLRYRDRVYGIAFRITGSSTDALDVAQESFSLLFRKVANFRFQSLFSTWLFRIVVNCSIDHIRGERSKSRRAASLSLLDGSSEPHADDAVSPIERAQVSELEAHVQGGIQKLSPKLRAILVLRYLEGLSYEELTQALDISMGTVKSRLARAHVALERVLSGTLTTFGYPEGPGTEDAGSGTSEGVA